MNEYLTPKCRHVMNLKQNYIIDKIKLIKKQGGKIMCQAYIMKNVPTQSE